MTWILKTTSVTGRRDDGSIHVTQRRGHWGEATIVAVAKREGIKGLGTLCYSTTDMNEYPEYNDDATSRRVRRVLVAPRSFAETRRIYALIAQKSDLGCLTPRDFMLRRRENLEFFKACGRG